MLLVPLSNMKVRVCRSAELDWPLTVMPEELSCQNPDEALVRDAEVRLPVITVRS